MNTNNTADDNCTDYILRFKTVQASGIQKLIECMKDILTDVNWEFDSSGIKVICMDGSHVCLINMKLNQENFEYFYCPNKIKVGISMNNFAKLIKNIGNNDAIEMHITTKNENVLTIMIDNMDKNISTVVNLKLLDIDDADISIPDTTPDTIITMSSQELQRYFRDLLIVSDILHVEACSEYLKLSCNGDFADKCVLIKGGSNNNEDSQVSSSISHKQIVKGRFSLKYLNLFTKGSTNMCSVVEIMLKNDYPIIIKYAVASLGHITFCLAPKVDDS